MNVSGDLQTHHPPVTNRSARVRTFNVTKPGPQSPIRDALDKAFTGRQRFIFPAVKLALEVSFGGFLGGLALIGIELPKIPAMTSPSEDSSQSTSATG